MPDLLWYRVTSPVGKPSAAQIRDAFGLSEDELDRGYGVCPEDEAAGTYTIRVRESARAKLVSGRGWIVEGPFSDARISAFGTFGPPESG